MPTENGRGCSNVSMEEEVSFNITIRVDQCKDEEDNNYTFNIEVCTTGLNFVFSNQ